MPFGKKKEIKLEEPLEIPSVPLKLPKFEFSWDETTPFANKFLVEGKKISTIAEDMNYYQITSKQTIPQNAITELTFQLHQYGSQHSRIRFGIIT